MIDYYKQIDEGLKRYEAGLPPTLLIEWLGERIDWCYRWKHITKSQMEELCDRVVRILEERT